MPKPKVVTTDKSVVDSSKAEVSREAIACGAPTPELARHIPNEETVKALQDREESHKLSEYDSFEAFVQAILDS